MHPVNSLGLTKRSNNFLYTVGGEGNMHFWDLDQKQKIKTFHYGHNPISAASIDDSGYFLAYSLGYDWHSGIQMQNQFTNFKLNIHIIAENETKHIKTNNNNNSILNNNY